MRIIVYIIVAFLWGILPSACSETLDERQNPTKVTVLGELHGNVNTIDIIQERLTLANENLEYTLVMFEATNCELELGTTLALSDNSKKQSLDQSCYEELRAADTDGRFSVEHAGLIDRWSSNDRIAFAGFMPENPDRSDLNRYYNGIAANIYDHIQTNRYDSVWIITGNFHSRFIQDRPSLTASLRDLPYADVSSLRIVSSSGGLTRACINGECGIRKVGSPVLGEPEGMECSGRLDHDCLLITDTFEATTSIFDE